MEITERNNLHTNQVLPILDNGGDNVWLLFLTPWIITSKQKIGLNRGYTYRGLKNIKEVKLPLPSIMGMMYWFFMPIFLLVAIFPFVRVIRQKSIDKVHCRGYSGALLCLFYNRLFKRSVEILFDPRGTYPEEGIITGRWSSKSLSYRLWKRIELRLLKDAAVVFCLSKGMERYYRSICPGGVYIIAYALVDVDKFKYDSAIRNALREAHSISSDDIVCIYIGSIGQWHDESSLKLIYNALIERYHNNNVKLFILTGQQLSIVAMPNVHVDSVRPDQVAQYLMMSDLGILPGKSDTNEAHEVLYNTMISSKVQEYLVSGLDVVCSDRIAEVMTYFDELDFGIRYDSQSKELSAESNDLFVDDQVRLERSEYFSKLFSSKTSVSTYYQEYNTKR